MTRHPLFIGSVCIGLIALLAIVFSGGEGSTALRGQVGGHCDSGITLWRMRVLADVEGGSSCNACATYFNTGTTENDEQAGWFSLSEKQDEEENCVSDSWVSPSDAVCTNDIVAADEEAVFAQWELERLGDTFAISANAKNAPGEYLSFPVPGNPMIRTRASEEIRVHENAWNMGGDCEARNIRVKLYPIINPPPLVLMASDVHEIIEGWKALLSPAELPEDGVQTGIRIRVSDEQGVEQGDWSVAFPPDGPFRFVKTAEREGQIQFADGIPGDMWNLGTVDFTVTARDGWGAETEEYFEIHIPPAVCGDGVVNSEGEQCDDGSHCADGKTCIEASTCAGQADDRCIPRAGGGCNAFCKVEGCGNGRLDPGEGCDDGRHCSDGTQCESRNDCSHVEGSDKECAVRAEDNCSVLCQYETCGDGVMQPSREQCDNGGVCVGSPCQNDAECGEGHKCLGLDQSGEGIGVCVYHQGGEPLPCTIDSDNECMGKVGFEECRSMGGDGCSAWCKDEFACCPAGGDEQLCFMDEAEFCSSGNFAESCEQCPTLKGLCIFDQGGVMPPFVRLYDQTQLHMCVQPVTHLDANGIKKPTTRAAIWVPPSQLPPNLDIATLINETIPERLYLGPEPAQNDETDEDTPPPAESIDWYCAVPGINRCIPVEDYLVCLESFGYAFGTQKYCQWSAFGEGVRDGEHPDGSFLPPGLIPDLRLDTRPPLPGDAI